MQNHNLPLPEVIMSIVAWLSFCNPLPHLGSEAIRIGVVKGVPNQGVIFSVRIVLNSVSSVPEGPPVSSLNCDRCRL